MKLKAPTDPSWPKALKDDALWGLAGDIVRTIAPHTEADPSALLIQLLVSFGNVVGRGLHFTAGKTRHGLNMFAVLVGETSKARKGTSWGYIKELVSKSDSQWAGDCVQTGLSSGEGVIFAVRDSLGQDIGVADKRLLVMEEEFASPLRMLGRIGNTLSPVLRLAWDGKALQVLTRQSPFKATDPHISIVGHITRDELHRELTRSEIGNGFANRFLWTCVRRHNTLPDGGRVPEDELAALAYQLASIVEWARSSGDCELIRDEDAQCIWEARYPELSEGKQGLLGAVISRAEAQVMRLACIYAGLDQSTVITGYHILAAMAVWEYCEASARHIFGDSLGDPIADTLLRKLRDAPRGLTRTELSYSLGRNRDSAEIERALRLLESAGLARCRRQESTGGRPSERWFAKHSEPDV